MGDEKTRLHHLFAANSDSNSKIIYSDGLRKISVSFNEVQKHAFFIRDFLKNLNLTGTTVCILTQQGLALPAIILGILNVDSAFAFLDVYKPLESLLAYQKYELIKTLIVQERYLKDLKSKLCCCWKKTSKFYAFSEYILLQSSDCTNDACPNSKVYEKFEMHSEIAYIIQTSGTTGEPKIVKVPHSCIIPNIIDLRSKFSVTVDDVILQSTLITFDPSIIEIFLSLSTGATLVMIPDHIRSIPAKLLNIIAANNITVLQGTPSVISSVGEKAMKEVLLSNESALRVLAFGGEVCPSFSKLQQWKSERNSTEIYNLYGLTEVSCWATCFRIDFLTGKSLTSIPLGDPLLNTVIEIRDKNGEISDTGEMQIGGPGRFCIIDDEQWPKSSDSIMRPTGDMVRKTADGFIYFEGRIDDEIKCRGHKISLPLISNIVATFPEIENSFVHFDDLSCKLYIFITLPPEGCFDSEVEMKLIRKLRKAVPNLPAIVFIPVPFFPVTKNGKIDRKKLLSLLDANEVQRKYTSAKSTMRKKCEDLISDIWKNYTSQTSIMETDNFIMNGGDSLTAVQFVSDIEWHLQLSLPLLIEKILNETLCDVKQYVNSCLEDNDQSAKLTLSCKSNSDSLECVNQPSSMKMCSDFKCFKFASKKGHFEYCFHSKNCFQQECKASQSCSLDFSLVLEWDLKKCIDATPCIFYEPQLNQHYIFIGSHSGIFSCINLNEKLEKWQISVPGRIESSACISSCGNYVLFGCYDHHLYCIKIADGSISWKYETGAEVKSSPTVSFSNKAFVGSHDKHVYAIDVKSGSLLWKKQVAYGCIFSSPSVIESLSAVCIGTLDGTLALLSMESGDILWKSCFGKPLFSSPVIISNHILIGSTDNCIHCLDFTGKEVFKYATEGPVFSSAACFDNYEKNLVFFGCHDFHVYCLTLTGDLVWKTLCDSAIYAAPLQFKLNNCLYICVASSKGTLYIIDTKNGGVVLSWSCPGEIFSSPVILDGILAVGCRDNNIYCFTVEALHFLK